MIAPTSRARVIALLLCAVVAGPPATGCAPEVPRFEVPDLGGEPLATDFTVTIDPGHASLATGWLEPVSAPVTVGGGAPGVALVGAVKRAGGRPGMLWLDLTVDLSTDLGLREATLEIEGVDVRDWTVDPLVDDVGDGQIALGRIAPHGLARVSLGLETDGVSPLAFDVHVRGVTSSRVSASASTLAVSPDGAEVWAPFPDADVVVVIDAASRERLATLPIPGHPASVSITPDGRFVLVASPSTNELRVVDRATRAVVRTFGESDGLGREPRHVVATPDGGRIVVSAYVGDRITVLERKGDELSIERHIDVGRRPTGISVSPDGTSAFVSHFLPRGPILSNEGWISVLDLEAGALAREVVIHDHFNVEDARCIADVFGVSPMRMTSEGVATQLAGAFLDPAGREAWVPGTRAAGAAIAWEAGDGGREGLENLVSVRPGEFVPPFVFLFDTRSPLQADRILVPGALERPTSPEYVRCARFQAELEFVSHDVIPSAPDSQVNRFLAFPSGIAGLRESGVMRAVAFTRGGRRALLLSHVADQLVVVDAATHHPVSREHLTLTGSNPTGIAVSPDGRTAWVSYQNSTFLSVLDLSAYADDAALPGPSYVPYQFREVSDVPQIGVAFMSQLLVRRVDALPESPEIVEVGTVPLVDADPMDPTLRRGAVLFASANPAKWPLLSRSANGACGSCHPDGGTDGSAWATMEGERRTISLRGGVAGRGWLHASATHPNAHEFAEVIVRERLGGALPPEDVDALAAYVARGIPRLQGPRVDEALAAAGQRVFERSCAACHSGETFGSGNPSPDDPLGGGTGQEPLLFDVGTGVDDAHVALPTFFESLLDEDEADLLRTIRGDRDLGPGDPVEERLRFRGRPARARGLFKAPSLLGAWDDVLFFHDGRFSTLEETVAHLDATLDLGLTAEERRAVVEYVRTL